MMNIGYINLFVIFITLLISYQANQITFADDEISCQIKSDETFNINPQTGNLLFSIEGIVNSIDGSLLAKQDVLFNGNVSPDGLHLATFTRENDNRIVQVFDLEGNVIYSGAPSKSRSGSVHWLNKDRILSFVTLNLGRGGGNTEYGVGYFVIDPFNQQYTYYEPSQDSTFYTQIPDSVFIEGIYKLTYDGHYLFNADRPIYNFETEQQLSLNNYRWGTPSLTSHRLISVDYVIFDNEGFYPLMVYDFDTDMVTQVTAFTPDSEVVPNHENSWSPDESVWFYTLRYPSEDLDSFRRIEFVELNTGTIHSTCFGQNLVVEDSYEIPYVRGVYSPDFAWSRDGRYLALMAVIEGQDMEESFGLYLYDTQTEDIYLVHQGDADIIGWMAHSEQD